MGGPEPGSLSTQVTWIEKSEESDQLVEEVFGKIDDVDARLSSEDAKAAMFKKYKRAPPPKLSEREIAKKRATERANMKKQARLEEYRKAAAEQAAKEKEAAGDGEDGEDGDGDDSEEEKKEEPKEPEKPVEARYPLLQHSDEDYMWGVENIIDHFAAETGVDRKKDFDDEGWEYG